MARIIRFPFRTQQNICMSIPEDIFSAKLTIRSIDKHTDYLLVNMVNILFMARNTLNDLDNATIGDLDPFTLDALSTE